MGIIEKKIREECNRSRKLRSLALDSHISFEKGQEIQRLQNESYNKFLFYKNLGKAMGGRL